MSLTLFKPVLLLTLAAVLAACSGPAASAVPAPTRGAAESVPAQPSVAPTLGAAASTPAAQPGPNATAPATASAGCIAPAGLTPALTEGPYFKAGSPERSSLIGSLPGTRLVLTGQVLDRSCQPVAHALLDFWQADSQGSYDNAGYTLRGHQYTDANGRYQLVTVVPGLYPGRTEHIHFKVQAPGGPLLTSQLFFPGVAQNQSDGIYDARLLISMLSSSAAEMQASFNFIVATQ